MISRPISVTQAEREALIEAKFRRRSGSMSAVIADALGGDPAALDVLGELWPPPTEEQEAWREIGRLMGERRAAARRLDAAEHDRLTDEIDAITARHPQRQDRDRKVSLREDVIAALKALAKQVPSMGRGARPIAEGIRVLLNGRGKGKR